MVTCHLAFALSSLCSGTVRLTSPVMKILGSTRSSGTCSGYELISGGAAPTGTATRSSMSVGCTGVERSSLTPYASRFTSRGTTTRATMDSSGRFVGIVERSEEHTSELQSRRDLVCRLLLEKKKKKKHLFFVHEESKTTTTMKS